MRRPDRFLGILFIHVGSLLGCGGSDALPPEDPVSVDTSPQTVTAPPAPAPEPPDARAETPPPAPPPAEPVKTAEVAPPPPAVVVVEGTIASRSGALLVVTPAAGSKGPPVGSKGNLFRYFEQQVGPFNTTGWLGIADVTVKGVKEGRLELTIDAEKSEIVVNGRKVNHFEAGNRVKLEPAK
ncbi:MAG: hypothetical protein HUU21_12675 [Polyangiaceae bacterium]|nr:hypothetical protein [Polyangiaceae bacterium]